MGFSTGPGFRCSSCMDRGRVPDRRGEWKRCPRCSFTVPGCRFADFQCPTCNVAAGEPCLAEDGGE